MRAKIRSVICAVGALVITGFSSINAAAVSYTFTGQIDIVIGSFAGFPPFDQLNTGDLFTLSYDVDPSLNTDQLPADAALGAYQAGSNWKFVSGSVELTQPVFGVGVANESPDGYAVTVPFFANSVQVVFGLTDSTGTVFDSDALPIVLDLADFDFRTLSVFGPTGQTISGTVTGPGPTPEPATIALVLLSLGGLATVTRRRN